MTVLTNVLTAAGLIIIGVLLFELIIFFHEGGHFLSAKLSGVKVNEFSLGMGPKLFSFTKGETAYSLRLLPIGGFCAMEGEDEDSDNPRAFNNAKLYKRLIIIVAGAFMNIVLGLILMAIILIPGECFTNQTVSEFTPQSYSANSGLEVGDTIIEVNGYNVNNSLDLSYSLAKLKVQDVDGTTLQIYKQDCTNSLVNVFNSIVSDGQLDDYTDEQYSSIYYKMLDATSQINSAASQQEAEEAYQKGVQMLSSEFSVDSESSALNIEVKKTRPRFRADLTVERDGEKVYLEDVDFMTYTTDDDTPKMSIDFYVSPVEKNVLTLAKETGSRTYSVVRMVVDSLLGLVKGEFGFSDVSGPIGAARTTVEVAQKGLKTGFGDAVLNIVYVMMIISVNLGVVNMLPFPALDGGRFLFLLIEGIFRRPIPRKAEGIINMIGLGILLLFMLIVSLKDIWQLIFK